MRRALPPSPAVVGIVNVTPDSFSDGGAFLHADAAAAHGVRLVEDGATWLDVGGESTRPGAEPVDAATERERVLPVLERLRSRTDVTLSVDTRRASTAAAALAAGADLVNDVSMLRHDPAMATVVAEHGAGLVLMHSRGTPTDMQRLTNYDHVVDGVLREIRAARDAAVEAGVDPSDIVLDPGFGFAKDAAQQRDLLAGLPRLRTLGHPIMVGLSRKSFIGTLLGDARAPRPVAERVWGSVGAALGALVRGADYLRVHDVAATCDALTGFLAASSPAASEGVTWTG